MDHQWTITSFRFHIRQYHITLTRQLWFSRRCVG